MDEYAKLENIWKVLPYLIDRENIEHSLLRDEFNKLKSDLMELCGLLSEYPIIISDSDSVEIYREINEYCFETADGEGDS